LALWIGMVAQPSTKY